tara:strand:+ start:15746 stop:16171 length:426 start_codon:yes stop_codon:yes gene_type:complete
MNKSYAERYIDRAMNDGVERTSNGIINAIMSYIEEKGGTFTYVPTERKVTSYVGTNKNYKITQKSNSRHSNMYVKMKLCNTCDGSGFKNHKNCSECNPENKPRKCKQCAGTGQALEMPCGYCKGIGEIENELDRKIQTKED